MARALGLANHPEAISVDSSNNVTVEGNFDVNGTQTIIDSTTVAVTDSLFKLAKDNTTADTLDAGWYGVYNDGSTRYAGIARDATDGKFIVYDGLTAEPGTTIDTGHASFNKATLSVGAVEDAIGDVRTAPVTNNTSASFTVPSGSSGKMFRLGTGTTTVNVNVANFNSGDIVTLVNALNTTVALSFDAWTNGVRIAGGDGTNLASTSTTNIAAFGVVTLIASLSTQLVVNGNVS